MLTKSVQRILVINRMFPLQVSGSERIAWETMTRLAERGIEIHSLYGRVPQRQPKIRRQKIRNKGITFHPIWHPLIRPPLDGVLFSIYANTYMKSLVKKQHIDLVAHHGCATSLITHETVPSVYHVHGPQIAELISFYKFETRSFERMVYFPSATLADFFGTQKATLCITTSRHSAKYVAGYYKIPPQRIRIVPGGVDLEKFSLARQSKDYILFVGQDLKRKNLGGLIKAMGMLPKKYRKLSVIGGYKPEYEALAKRFHIDAEFLGPTSESQLVRYYQKCAVFACPSFHEGFGLPFLEAQACGKPCIGSWKGGIPEIVINGRTGYLVNPQDTNELAKTLLYLLEDEKLRKKMGMEARKWAENFSWDKVAEKTLQVYNEAFS